MTGSSTMVVRSRQTEATALWAENAIKQSGDSFDEIEMTGACHEIDEMAIPIVKLWTGIPRTFDDRKLGQCPRGPYIRERIAKYDGNAVLCSYRGYFGSNGNRFANSQRFTQNVESDRPDGRRIGSKAASGQKWPSIAFHRPGINIIK